MKRFVLLMMVAFFAAQPQLFAQNQQKKIEILIEPTYERVAGDYSRSLPYVYVKKDGLWGYINVFEGKEILPPKYTQASIFNNGEAVVELDGKRKVFINIQGEILREHVKPEPTPKSKSPKPDKSRRVVGENRTVVTVKKMQYLADGNGTFLDGVAYDRIYDPQYGLYIVSRDGYYGCIDNDGKVVIPIKYANIKFRKDGTLNYNVEDNLCGIMDLKGNVLIKPMYRKIYEFNGDIAAVSKYSSSAKPEDNYNLYGFIRRDGSKICDVKYGDCFLSFSDGLAGVKTYVKGVPRWGYIDTLDREVIEPQFSKVSSDWTDGFDIVKKYDCYGMIDKSGKMVIPAVHMSITKFNSDGYAIVSTVKNGLSLHKYGVVDREGNYTIEPQYTSLFRGPSGYLIVIDNGLKNCVVDYYNNTIIPFYDELYDCGNSYWLFKQDGLWGVLRLVDK